MNNLSYETAVKLRDAGFPFRLMAITHPDAPPIRDIAFDDGNDYYHYPSLSELIDACGAAFGGLDHFPYERTNKFRAYERSPGQKTREVYGVTPTEAVANLYLALHNK